MRKVPGQATRGQCCSTCSPGRRCTPSSSSGCPEPTACSGSSCGPSSGSVPRPVRKSVGESGEDVCVCGRRIRTRRGLTLVRGRLLGRETPSSVSSFCSSSVSRRFGNSCTKTGRVSPGSELHSDPLYSQEGVPGVHLRRGWSLCWRS